MVYRVRPVRLDSREQRATRDPKDFRDCKVPLGQLEELASLETAGQLDKLGQRAHLVLRVWPVPRAKPALSDRRVRQDNKVRQGRRVRQVLGVTRDTLDLPDPLDPPGGLERLARRVIPAVPGHPVSPDRKDLRVRLAQRDPRATRVQLAMPE